MPPTATLRDLNRATLARQMLRAREKVTALQAIERLVALQAQWPRPPHIGLWTRVEGFRRADLNRLHHERKAVRATSLRGTLHVMSAKDFAPVRAAIQPSMDAGAGSILRGRASGIDVDRLLRDGRAMFREGPLAFETVRDRLAERHPSADIRAMAYLVRIRLPLVQVPTEAPWGFPTVSEFALADSWLGAWSADATAGALARRYLAAFGPALPADLKLWSGLTLVEAKAEFAAIEGELVTVRDERRRTLFDLKSAPRPGGDAAAPPRFLPEFDNLLLAHVDRRRFVDDAHRPRVFLPGLRVAPTFLRDGFVAGTWKVERAKDAATLEVSSFAALKKADREALGEEAEALARFVEPDARRFAVRFERAG